MSRSSRLTAVGVYERVALGIASHWPFDQWGRFLPETTRCPGVAGRGVPVPLLLPAMGRAARTPVFAQHSVTRSSWCANMALHSITCETCRTEDLCAADVVPYLVEVQRHQEGGD
jgi:hypothetical protein